MDTSIPRASTPLRQRMVEDMRMRKPEDKTQQAYIRGARHQLGQRQPAAAGGCQQRGALSEPGARTSPAPVVAVLAEATTVAAAAATGPPPRAAASIGFLLGMVRLMLGSGSRRRRGNSGVFRQAPWPTRPPPLRGGTPGRGCAISFDAPGRYSPGLRHSGAKPKAASMQPLPLRVFVSYSHKDEALKIALRGQLAAMERRGLIEVWDDRAIPAGSHWEDAILGTLERADLILLLISPDFIKSDYCYGEEMARGVERHVAGTATLVPVLMRPCQWDTLPFIEEHKIQAVPRDGKVITEWPNQDAALKQVADELRLLVEGSAARPAAATTPRPATATTAPAAAARPDIPPLLADLCDRGDQDAAFDSALRAALAQPARRPFVFVLFGESVERDHGFRERLAEVRIKRLLDLARLQTSVERLSLGDPSACYGDLAEAFRAELGNQLLGDLGASRQHLFDYVRGHPPPLLMTSLFVGSDSLQRLRKLVPAMLAEWAGWPNLPAERSLIHCLSIRFDAPADPSAALPPLEEAAREDIRKYLRRLAGKDGSGFRDYPAVAGRVLPELRPVTPGHAETWAGTREVAALTRIAPEDVQQLFARSRQRRPDGSIPMQFLVPDILQLATERRI